MIVVIDTGLPSVIATNTHLHFYESFGEETIMSVHNNTCEDEPLGVEVCLNFVNLFYTIHLLSYHSTIGPKP